MATYPLVQFVDKPEVGASVRFDFNAAGSWASEDVWPGHDGFDLGSPTLDGDPDAVGVEYGFRRLAFNLFIQGSRPAAASAMSALAKELLRRTNWLLVQSSPSSAPVWFKTYRTQPGSIDFELVQESDEASTNNVWGIGVTLDADPFAYGARETIGPVTINNDPAAATNPSLYVLPTIKGDAPAPLRLRVSSSVIQARTATTAFLSVLGSDVAPTTMLRPSGTAGTDATLNTGTGVVGGDYFAVSFSTTATLATRVSYLLNPLVHGSYKALLRVSPTTTGSTFDIRLRNKESTPRDYLAKTVTLGQSYRYIDLGTFDWPAGGRVGDDFLADSSRFTADLAIARTAGTATLNVDDLLLIPVSASDGDADSAFVTFATSESPVDGAYIDGESETVRLVGSTDLLVPGGNPSTVVGGFVSVVPAVTNVLRYLQTTTPPDTYGDDLTATTTVTLSYAPRYLYLGSS